MRSCRKSVTLIHQEINGYRPVPQSCKPVTQPSVSSPKIENGQGAVRAMAKQGEDGLLYVSVSLRTDRPLPGVSASHIAVRQGKIKLRITAVAPFSFPNKPILLHELSKVVFSSGEQGHPDSLALRDFPRAGFADNGVQFVRKRSIRECLHRALTV